MFLRRYFVVLSYVRKLTLPSMVRSVVGVATASCRGARGGLDGRAGAGGPRGGVLHEAEAVVRAAKEVFVLFRKGVFAVLKVF